MTLSFSKEWWISTIGGFQQARLEIGNLWRSDPIILGHKIGVFPRLQHAEPIVLTDQARGVGGIELHRRIGVYRMLRPEDPRFRLASDHAPHRSHHVIGTDRIVRTGGDQRALLDPFAKRKDIARSARPTI